MKRGRIGVYAVAFGLLMVAVLIFAVTTIGSLQSVRLLWASAGFSVAALVTAVVSVVVRSR